MKHELLAAMVKLATDYHHGQYDRAGKPYILHPISVMIRLNTDDEELNCIALGHDLLEDTSVTDDLLRDHGMTHRIINGIKCLTKVDGESYEDYKKKVLSNYDSIRVKLMDIGHNTDLNRNNKLTEKDFERLKKYLLFREELKFALGDMAKRIVELEEQLEHAVNNDVDFYW